MISPTQPSDTTQVDWTVSRCNRLRRALTSIISQLRKLKERKEALNSSSSSQYHPVGVAKPASRSILKDEKEQAHADPDWVSGLLRTTKTRKNYSARTRNPPSDPAPQNNTSAPTLQPGELSIPTPYISKRFQHLHSPSTSQNAASSAANPTLPRPRTVGRPRIEEGKKEDIIGDTWVSKTEDEYVLLQNLAKRFLELIDATNLSVQKSQSPILPHRGARSLLSTCCRQVPAFIAQEEYRQMEEEEEDHVDVATQAYELLEEELGVVPGRGWRPLREIVRAHGVALVKDAMMEGLIPRITSRTIIKHLYQPQRHQTTRPSPMEADDLLSALVRSESPSNPSACCHRNQFYANSFNNLASQINVVEPAARYAWEVRLFANLLDSPYIPHEWMVSHRVVPLWNTVVRLLLDPASEATHAYRFLEQVVAVGTGVQPSSAMSQKVFQEIPAQFAQTYEACPKCPRPEARTFLRCSTDQQPPPSANQTIAKSQLSTALTTTLSSLSTMLASFTIAARIDPKGSPKVNLDLILWSFNAFSVDIISHHSNKSTINTSFFASTTPHFAERRSAFILASTLIIHLAGCPLDTSIIGADVDDIVRCIEGLNDQEKQNDAACNIVDSLPEMMLSIAKSASGILNTDAFASLKHIVRSLNAAGRGEDFYPATKCFLRRLALSTAIESANQEKTPRYHGFVREVERTMTRAEVVSSRTPRHQSSKPSVEATRGFKWEEGICEWVAETPKMFHRKNFFPNRLNLATYHDQLTAPDAPFAPVPSPITSFFPVPRPPVTPSSSDAPSNHDSSPDADVESSLKTSPATETDELNISDMLLARSSPLNISPPITASTRLHRPARKRSRTDDDDSEDGDFKVTSKKTRNSNGGMHTTAKQSRTQASSGRTATNDAPARHNASNNPRPVRQQLMKRTLSAPVAQNASSSDEDELGTISAKKQPAKRASKARRTRRGALLRSISATISFPVRNPSFVGCGGKMSDDEDDELSFA